MLPTGYPSSLRVVLRGVYYTPCVLTNSFRLLSRESLPIVCFVGHLSLSFSKGPNQHRFHKDRYLCRIVLENAEDTGHTEWIADNLKNTPSYTYTVFHLTLSREVFLLYLKFHKNVSHKSYIVLWGLVYSGNNFFLSGRINEILRSTLFF